MKREQHNIGGNMNLSLEEDGLNNYLVINPDTRKPVIQYQLKMLNHNPHFGIIPVEQRVINNQLKLYYRLDLGISLAQYVENEETQIEDIVSILDNILGVLLESKNYLLYASGFLLHEEYIFITPGTLETGLIYVPIKAEGNVVENFRGLLIRMSLCREDFPRSLRDYARDRCFNLKGFRDKLKEDRFPVIPEEKRSQEREKPFHLNITKPAGQGIVPVNGWDDQKKSKSVGRAVNEWGTDNKVVNITQDKNEGKTTQCSMGGLSDKLIVKPIYIFVFIQLIIAIAMGCCSPLLNSLGDTTGTYGGMALIIGALDILLLKRLFKIQPVKTFEKGRNI